MIHRKIPLSTVVIPVFNGEEYLRESLLSVADQVCSYEFKVLVINDGSTDSSLKIAREFEFKHTHFNVIDLPKSGLVGVLNQALKLTDTPLISRHDADDVMVPQRLQIQLEEFEANTEFNCIGGQIKHFSTSSDRKHFKSNYYPEEDQDIKSLLLRKNVFASPTVTYCRLCAIRVGGYRNYCDGAEDYDLWLRLTKYGLMKNDPQILTYYRVHPGQVTQAKVMKVFRATFFAKVFCLTNSKLGLIHWAQDSPTCHKGNINTFQMKFSLLRYLGLDLIHFILFLARRGFGKQ
jgi:glycosyltransferase involved in cell wall biosynthesis